ncbi:MAG: crossover junction endodeoxyribonuclease RuvC [Deltaproteobacteria bacterium]|nr:crossover junction endodeoxyribonuclease RuvC [Deltaproteobacteria bacterium]
MIILGIDPGSVITGYGLVEKSGGRVTHIENGGIFCKKGAPLEERLVVIFQKIQEIVTQFKPDAAAIETAFYAKNVQSLLKLGQARGTAIVATALLKLPVFEYTPLEVKQAVAGFGAAPKEQVQKMVMRLLNLPQIAEENASDALAIAICHAHSEKMRKIAAGGGI